MQQEDYDKWYTSAEIFYEHFKLDKKKGYLSHGAFHLHQTTEKSIAAYLLVKT
jgi:HEPN domain-containing protein